MKTHILSKHPTIYPLAGTTNVTNSFDMAKEIALTNAQKTVPYPKTHQKYLVHFIHLTDSIPSYDACACVCDYVLWGLKFESILMNLAIELFIINIALQDSIFIRYSIPRCHKTVRFVPVCRQNSPLSYLLILLWLANKIEKMPSLNRKCRVIAIFEV